MDKNPNTEKIIMDNGNKICLIYLKSLMNEMSGMQKELLDTQTSVENKNLIISSLTDELKNVRKEMSLKQEKMAACIVKTVQTLSQYNKMVETGFKKLKFIKKNCKKSEGGTKNKKRKKNKKIINKPIKTEIIDLTLDQIDDSIPSNSNNDKDLYKKIKTEDLYKKIQTILIKKVNQIGVENVDQMTLNLNNDGNYEKESNNQETQGFSINKEEESTEPVKELASQSYINQNSHGFMSSRLKKKFKCTKCWKSYTKFGCLKTHRRVHTGIKPFKCKKCPERFKQFRGLKTHLRNQHSVKNLYKCVHCPKRFSETLPLKNHHIKKHSDETPYRCEYCEKRYKSFLTLNNHIFKVNSDKKNERCF